MLHIKNDCFIVAIHHLWLLQLFWPLFIVVSEPWEKEVWYVCSIGLSILKLSLHTDQLWVTVLIDNSF